MWLLLLLLSLEWNLYYYYIIALFSRNYKLCFVHFFRRSMWLQCKCGTIRPTCESIRHLIKTNCAVYVPFFFFTFNGRNSFFLCAFKEFVFILMYTSGRWMENINIYEKWIKQKQSETAEIHTNTKYIQYLCARSFSHSIVISNCFHFEYAFWILFRVSVDFFLFDFRFMKLTILIRSQSCGKEWQFDFVYFFFFNWVH